MAKETGESRFDNAVVGEPFVPTEPTENVESHQIFHKCKIHRSFAKLFARASGVPVISCERDYIRVTVATARPFAGKIFVKGEYANRDCMRSYVNGVALPTESAGSGESHMKAICIDWEYAADFANSGSLRSQTRVRPTFNKKQQGLESERVPCFVPMA